MQNAKEIKVNVSNLLSWLSVPNIDLDFFCILHFEFCITTHAQRRVRST